MLTPTNCFCCDRNRNAQNVKILKQSEVPVRKLHFRQPKRSDTQRASGCLLLTFNCGECMEFVPASSLTGGKKKNTSTEFPSTKYAQFCSLSAAEIMSFNKDSEITAKFRFQFCSKVMLAGCSSSVAAPQPASPCLPFSTEVGVSCQQGVGPHSHLGRGSFSVVIILRLG